MLLFVDNQSGLPIYDQIYTQIKNLILKGELTANDPLPSIRSLAKELRISVITTKRAYEELEKEGFVYTVPSKGCFVAQQNMKKLRQEKLKQLREKLAEAAAMAKDFGLTVEEMSEILQEEMEELR